MFHPCFHPFLSLANETINKSDRNIISTSKKGHAQVQELKENEPSNKMQGSADVAHTNICTNVKPTMHIVVFYLKKEKKTMHIVVCSHLGLSHLQSLILTHVGNI